MDTESKRRRIVDELFGSPSSGAMAADRDDQRPASLAETYHALEPIAIVGLSGYFPQCMSAGEFWEALDEGRSLIEPIPDSRFDRSTLGEFGGRESDLDRARWGGFIPDVRGFDPAFFNILPDEAEVMDPRRRLLLMSVYQTLEDAGYAPETLKGSETGVYVAAEENEYLQLLLDNGGDVGSGFGQASSMVANHISYHFDFRGTSEFVNAMCAGGAIALHRAVVDLRAGKVSQAVVGAANLLLRPEPFLHLAGMGQLSPEATVRSFGPDAQGYLRAEAVASLLLKPLSQAESDGDGIYAVIRNSAVNSNGRGGMSIASPSTRAHADLISRCYGEAGIDPRDVGYIEAQGMGNPATDISEWEAFNQALTRIAVERGVSLGPGQCGVSTLKPTAGHMHAASALGALFKVIRSLQTGRLRGILDFETAHPELDIQGQPCRLIGTSQDFPANSEGARLAGLHSYSSGGTNAHLLIGEYVPEHRSDSLADTDKSRLVILSAKSPERLRERASQLHACVVKKPSLGLSDLAYTLQLGRDPMRERLAILCTCVSDLVAKLGVYLEGRGDGEHCWKGSAPGGHETPEIDPGVGLETLALSWVQGGRVDWSRLYRGESRQRLHLPTYPFARDEYWFKQRGEPADAPLEASVGTEQFVSQLSSQEVDFLISELQTAPDLPEATVAGNGLSEDFVGAAIRDVLAATLRVDAGTILPTGEFADYGLDSINGTKFVQALEESLDVTIPPKWMFDHPSVGQLARVIYRNNQVERVGGS